MNDCKFTENESDFGGGGLACRFSSSPTLNRCVFENNQVRYDGGGGVHCYLSSAPTLNNCTFTNNDGGLGGGLFCEYFSAPTVNNCVFTSNYSSGGGAGMFCGEQSNPLVANCTFENNTSGFVGGGVGCQLSSPTFIDCVISGNTAEDAGGGISCDGSAPTFSNTAVINNVAHNGWSDGIGGGLYCFNASLPMFSNVTIAHNSARASGGGVYSESSSEPKLMNCIVWGNFSPTAPGVQLVGGSIEVSYSCMQDAQGQPWFHSGSITANPLFVDPAANDFYLQLTSPCIDAGDPNSPFDGDGTRADMGAYFFDQTGLGPTVRVSNLIAGKTATASFSHCTPNNAVIFAWSFAGPGPVSTPFGQASVGHPYDTMTLGLDGNGNTTRDVFIPSSLSGFPVWMQGVDLGTGVLSNALAMTIQ